MTGSRVYIERDSCGNPRWIIRRHSHSYHRHHHPHRDWADERAHITNGELEKLKQRERELFEANDALVRENESLKANLRAAEDELQRHRTWVAELQQQVRQLTTENADLRRCLEEERQRHQHDGSAEEERLRREARELRHRNTRLENENDGLRRRVRDLTRQLREAVDERVGRLTEQVRALGREVAEERRSREDLEHRCRRLRQNLDDYIAANEALARENAALRRTVGTYERILRRHMLID